MKKILQLTIFTLLFFACGKQKEQKLPETTIYAIQDLGLLATTEYTFGKVLFLDDNKDWYRWGDRKILISVKAKVKAGVDLSKMNASDITIESDKKIKLLLPAPEVVSFNMDPNDIKTEMKDINGLRFDFSQEEKMRVQKMGEDAIQREMRESTILTDARKNARVFLTDFYKELGFEEVIIDFRSNN